MEGGRGCFFGGTELTFASKRLGTMMSGVRAVVLSF
jgi:hypothetical protein